MISVAIDGPSGAGKSSLAKRLAADMGFTYVDTGAMYRSIGLYAVRQGKDPHDAAAVEALLPQIHLDTKLEEGTQHFYLNGEDVSLAIRAEEIGMAASAVAAIPAVRTFLLDAQRTLAASRDVLMDGHGQGHFQIAPMTEHAVEAADVGHQADDHHCDDGKEDPDVHL